MTCLPTMGEVYSERSLRFAALALKGIKSLHTMTINYKRQNCISASPVQPSAIISRLKNMLQMKNSNFISSPCPWTISWTQGQDFFGGLKIDVNRSGEHSDDSDPEAAFKSFLDGLKEFYRLRWIFSCLGEVYFSIAIGMTLVSNNKYWRSIIVSASCFFFPSPYPPPH